MINPYLDYPTSKQDAFDRVWNWFVAEKHPPGVDADGCAYRGDDGCMCGIGVMVPDVDMPGDVRGTISTLIFRNVPFAIKMLDRTERDAAFLYDVQRSHDWAYEDRAQGEGDFHSLIESKLRGVAKEYHLSVPSNQGTP